MKIVISESQYNLILERELADLLKKRHSVIKHIIEKLLPEMNLFFYKKPERFVEGIIQFLIKFIDKNRVKFPYFEDISPIDIDSFVREHFKEMILDYYETHKLD